MSAPLAASQHTSDSTGRKPHDDRATLQAEQHLNVLNKLSFEWLPLMVMKRFWIVAILTLAGAFAACRTEQVAAGNSNSPESRATATKPINNQSFQNPGKLIHVLVALCDNQYQGIVPVPARIGNGDDPANNLYWGAAFGVKTFFKRSSEWKLIAEIQNPKPAVLQRIVFKHQTRNVYLVADAYRGREIKQTTADFLRFAAGAQNEVVQMELNSGRLDLSIGGGADLVAYVGHDGLMDFTLAEYPAEV